MSFQTPFECDQSKAKQFAYLILRRRAAGPLGSPAEANHANRRRSQRFGGVARSAIMRGIGLSLVLMLWTTTVADDQQPLVSRAQDDANSVAPFVGEATFLIMKVDATKLGLPQIPDSWKTLPPEARAAVAENIDNLKILLSQLQILADDQPIFGTVAIPTSTTQDSMYFFRRKTTDNNQDRVSEFITRQAGAQLQVYKDFLVATPGDDGFAVSPSVAASSSVAASQMKIASAFAATQEYPVQAVLLPPAHVWRTIRELSPKLPRALGGGPNHVLTDGLQWASIGVDPGRLRLKVVVQSTDQDAAKAFANHLPRMLSSLYAEAKPVHPRLPAAIANQLIEALKPEVENARVVIRIDDMEKNLRNLALLNTVASFIETKTRRNSHVKRFKQILLGMHNYHDVYQAMPPSAKHRGKDGQPLLSWRVHILPFIEQQALYEQFHLDESWDSPHNKTLLEKMPEIYSRNLFLPNEKKPKPGHTTFLAPVGDKTIFGGEKVTKLQHITDGTSNTVAIIEATPTKAVPWTAPMDFEFDAKNPLAGVLIGDDGHWLCALADGSVHHLPGSISPRTALYLFQMSDGQPVHMGQLR